MNTKNTILLGAVLILVVVGAFLFYQKGDRQVQKIQPPESGLTKEDTNIVALDQEADEDRVVIENVVFGASGYIVVHLSEDGKPGKVLGNTGLFGPGAYPSIAIPLNEVLSEGENNLFAMIHFDDGDSIYEFPGDDLPAKVDDQIVVKPFTVTKRALSIAPQDTTPKVKEFTVTAKRFTFDPDTFTVSKGDTVKFIITSTDVVHGFSISEFGVSEVLSPGATKTVEFVASKTGTYKMFCSQYCGSGHSTMSGTLIVE